MKVLMIQRAEQYSPNSVEKDLAILEAVASRLRLQGHEVTIQSETALAQGRQPDFIFSMARLPEILAILKFFTIPVINTPEGIENCARSRLHTIMASIGTPMPPQEGPDGYWLKRGDAAAQGRGDVVYCKTREQLSRAILEMEQRGIADHVVSAHVTGDLVKFYGVRGTDFFRYYYPTDDGQTKFDDEQHNGQAHHYPFDVNHLQQQVTRLAEAVGISIYGGDCIVRADGSYCVIDFNDWPSFSRCREEAADAIIHLI
ncbi:MAG: hypothetical protein IJ569_05750 [Prevotella sp.]|nr:hypothetical protein [Prevotella sp.]